LDRLVESTKRADGRAGAPRTRKYARPVREPELEPLLVMEPLAAFLDEAGLGSGEIEATELGDGHSNVTFLLRRGGERLVLRRPPRGPLPPSAHDVLREARLLQALEPLDLPVPPVLAVCDDESVIGAPFYVMPFIEGHVLSDALPPGYGDDAPERIGEELVDTLVRLHAIDFEAAGLGDFGRSDGYLERQLKRFNGLLELNATRPLPDLERVGEWLASNLPESRATTIVHGDYRLGNVMFAPAEPRLVAVLDWEMATIGDPLADVGYMTAMWSQDGTDDPPNPVGNLSPITRLSGFPSGEDLAQRYAHSTAHPLSTLRWYQTLAIWKAAIFLEGSFKRYQAGTTIDPYFAGLGYGVTSLSRLARKHAEL
jgi:aminoglycoside phosphotransferase (APT) family kinase protein